MTVGQTPGRRALALGLGNILLGDEGLGVRIVEQLQTKFTLSAEVQVMDGGTLGLDLLPYLAEVDDLLIVDAVHIGQPPGTLARLEGDQIPAVLAIKMSVHQVGLEELLAVAGLQGSLPAHLVIWGMEPGELRPGLDFTPAVAAALPNLLQGVVNELRAWGFSVGPKADNGPPAAGPGQDAVGRVALHPALLRGDAEAG